MVLSDIKFGSKQPEYLFYIEETEPEALYIGNQYEEDLKKLGKFGARLQRNIVPKSAGHEGLHLVLEGIGEPAASAALDNHELFGYMNELEPSGLPRFEEMQRRMKAAGENDLDIEG